MNNKQVPDGGKERIGGLLPKEEGPRQCVQSVDDTIKAVRKILVPITMASAMPMAKKRRKGPLYGEQEEYNEEFAENGERKIKPVQALFLIEADYGVLPDTHPAHQLAQRRLRALLPNVREQELPKIEVLASTGESINAFACENWTIVVTPELLVFSEFEEELDYVLLHEINHLLNEDHAQMGRPAIRDSLLRTVGALRTGEYRADIQAFYQAAEPERHSNPIGAISFLERLREKQGHDEWEAAHGQLTDRILNLKNVAGLLELDLNQHNPLIHRLTEPLTPIDPTIRESIASLKKGGYLTRILKSPPLHGSAYDEWEREIRLLLEKADLQLMQAALPILFQDVVDARVASKKFKNNRGATTAEVRYECYQHLLFSTLKRWDGIVDSMYKTMSGADRCSLKVCLLETCLRIPLFTINASEERSVLQIMEKKIVEQDEDMQLAVENKYSTKLQFEATRSRLNAAECILDIPFLKNLKKQFEQTLMNGEKHLLTDLGRKFALIDQPVKQGDALRFVSEIAKLALADYAIFDTEEGGIDYGLYLEEAVECLVAANDFEERKRFTSRTPRQYSLSDAWTEILLNGGFTLADLSQLDEKYAQAAESVCQKINAENDGVIMRFQSQQSYKNFDRYLLNEPQVAISLREYATHHWCLEIQKTQCLWLQRLEAICTEIWKGNEKNTDVGSQTALLEEASLIINKLPDPIDLSSIGNTIDLAELQREKGKMEGVITKEEFLPKYIDRLFFFGGKNRKNLVAAAFWIQTIANNDYEYNKLANEHISVDYEDEVTIGDIDALADAVVDLSSPNFYGQRKIVQTGVDLRADLYWQQQMIQKLQHQLKLINEPETFYQLLRDVLKRWKIVRPYDKDEYDGYYLYGEDHKLIIESISLRKTLEKGSEMLDLSENPLSSATLEKLLILSFFAEDITVSKPLQEYAVSQLLQESTFEEALELVCIRYKAQGILGAVGTMKFLENKAQTPAQLRKLLETLQEVGVGLDALTRAGEAVIIEGVVEVMLKRCKRLPLLNALLMSSKDETELKKIIADSWFWVYKQDVRNDVFYAYECESKKQLEKFASKRPKLLDHPTATADFPNYRSADSWRSSVYRLGAIERYAILRKLLTDPKNGALIGESNREDLLSSFFDTYLQQDSSDQIEPILRKILAAVMQKAPVDELSMMLTPLLRARIANPPQELTSWNNEALYISKIISSQMGLIEGTYGKQYGEPYIARHIEHMLLGHSPEQVTASTTEDRLLCVVPQSFFQNGKNAYSALEMTMDIAKNFGAPGVRFLQLLGQTIPLDEKYQKPFSAVYDSVEGQSKLSAWETIKNITPDYASIVERLDGRVGGGSLFTVYEMYLNDGSREVARVLNPNAWYHAQKFIHVIHEALNGVAKEDPRYEKTLPLLNLIEEWIRTELEDQTYEKDDEIFFKNWHNWAPNRRFKAKIVVPKSKKTGTSKVRREEYIMGENFTSLSSFKLGEQKELVALATQHYMAQVRGSIFDKETLVHSDISAGNLRRTHDGNLAILDRGMYLKFSLEDKLILKKLVDAKDVQSKSSAFIEWLLELPENQSVKQNIDPATLADEIVVQSNNKADIEDFAIDALVIARSYGLNIPLKFTLLFKNLNALRQLAQQVGFVSLKEAIQYSPQSNH